MRNMEQRKTTSMHLIYEVSGRLLETCEKREASTINTLKVTITRFVKSSLSKKKVKKAMRVSRPIGMKVVTTNPLYWRAKTSPILNDVPFSFSFCSAFLTCKENEH